MRYEDLWTDTVKEAGLRSTPWEVDLSSDTCSDRLEKTVRDLQKCSDVCGLIGTKVHRLEGESVVLVSFKFVCEMWVCVCTSVDLLCLCLKRERENSYEVCCLAFVQGHRHWRWREHSDTYSQTPRRLVLQRELCGDVLEYLFFWNTYSGEIGLSNFSFCRAKDKQEKKSALCCRLQCYNPRR